MGPVAGVPKGLRGARIAPGSPAEIGWVNAAITRVLGVATGGRPPHLFTTLARHRGLFRRWLWFAAALMPGGVLPRADSELLILRVAANCGCDYEWGHHERIALTAGLSAEQIADVRDGEGDFSQRQLLLLRAADELHAGRELSDETWAKLSAFLSEVELIELCMLVGHYEMLAMTLNSLRVEPDVLPDRQPRLMARVLKR
jgi:AhpD family alkylhydroperoxidase